MHVFLRLLNFCTNIFVWYTGRLNETGKKIGKQKTKVVPGEREVSFAREIDFRLHSIIYTYTFKRVCFHEEMAG